MTAEVFDRAAELRARYQLRTPDALHVATAVEHGCDQLWTNDQRLVRIPVDLTVEMVR